MFNCSGMVSSSDKLFLSKDAQLPPAIGIRSQLYPADVELCSKHFEEPLDMKTDDGSVVSDTMT